MSLLVLIPWPETTWSAATRIGGRNSVSLTGAGRATAVFWGQKLKDHQLDYVFTGEEGVAREIGKLMAKEADIRAKTADNLGEMDVGLWDGLTTKELQHRHPKVYKRWCNDASAVCPPDGEAFEAVQARVSKELSRLTRKYAGKRLAFVLGPLAFAVARCLLEGAEPHHLRNAAAAGPVLYIWPDEPDELPQNLAGRLLIEPDQLEPVTTRSESASGG